LCDDGIETFKLLSEYSRGDETWTKLLEEVNKDPFLGGEDEVSVEIP
jgi:hypothetical protein